jgi:hypothetical protein
MACETLKWFAVGGGKQVIGDAVASESLQEAIGISGRLSTGSPSLSAASDGRRESVLTIRHCPLQAVVARDDVTGQVRAGEIADVDPGIE